MAQFDVFRNPNPRTRASYPYLLDVQSPLFRDLSTRVVIPLAIASTEREAMQRLTPMLEVRGERLILMTPQLAGVTLDTLGEFVEGVADQRDLIVNALDFLLTGS